MLIPLTEFHLTRKILFTHITIQFPIDLIANNKRLSNTLLPIFLTFWSGLPVDRISLNKPPIVLRNYATVICKVILMHVRDIQSYRYLLRFIHNSFNCSISSFGCIFTFRENKIPITKTTHTSAREFVYTCFFIKIVLITRYRMRIRQLWMLLICHIL